MKNTSPVYVALWLLVSLLLLGCGAGQAPFNLAMHVLVQSASPVFDAGKNVNLNAIVQNDFSGRGVTWSIAGVNCRAGGCGSLAGTNSTNAIYVPPAAFANSFSVKITAVSVANGLITGTATLSVAQPLVITTTTLPVAAVGNAYSATLAAAGGVQPYLWTVLSGSLPDGLVLNSVTGVITGTPSSSQIANFVVQVADFGGIVATAAFSITVQDVSVSISPNAPLVIEPRQTVALTAAVQNDPANLGIKWSIAGPTCGAGSCGTLTSVTPLTATYVAPQQTGANTPVSVIATSIADTTRSAAEQFIIAGPLSVPTTSLLDGNVGVPYAERVFATGGIPPYSIAVTTGALPPGLTLDSGTGAITSIPTLKGRYDFTVTATDAGAAFAQKATRNLSITIGNALPLVITTVSLPDATLNAEYVFQLDATGGLRPYSWSLLASALPDGLTLSSDGIIAGTPKVVGSFPVTVQVADAQSAPFSVTKSFTLAVGYPHGPHDQALNGHYAFLFNGYEDGAGAVAFAGSFAADGAGNITGGVLDSNRTSGVTLGTSFTGRYLIGLDNRGEMTTQDANGQTKKFAFSVGTTDGSLAQTVRFIEFDDAEGISGTRGSGIMRLQDPTAFTLSALNGSYVFGLAGVTPVTSGTVGPVAIAGVITADGNGALNNGLADVNIINSVSQSLSVAGSYGALDVTSGREMTMLPLTGAPSISPTTYSLYLVNADEALMLSLDLRAQKSVMSGELHKQKLNTFSSTSLGNNFVIYENGVNADASNQPVIGQTNALIAVYSADGSGNCTLQAMDQNAGGIIQTYEQTGQSAAISCVVHPDGRATLGTKQTLYLYASGTGFYVENGLAALGHVEPQTSGPFTNASAPQTFFFGSISPASSSTTVSVGAGNFEHQALFAPVADVSTPTSLYPATTLFLPYVVDTYGRTILPDVQGGDPLGGIYVMYVLSPSRMIWFDENVANPSPSMQILETLDLP